MATSSLSGLSSGLDWSSFIDKIIAADSTPITRLKKEKTDNTTKLGAVSTINSQLTDLQTSTFGLNSSDTFQGRNAGSLTPGSTWTATAANGTVSGDYAIAVTQLATQATRKGVSNLAGSLNPTSNVSALTLSTLNVANAITAGKITVNGKPVTIATTDTLQQVFDKISTATSGDITGSYDPTSDTVSLASGSASEIVLGASNDTSNFLQSMKLTNNGTPTVSSSSNLSVTNLYVPLAQSNLKTAVTADGSGNGSVTINGTLVSYNINTDSLNNILNRINGSAAGVTATFDRLNDRVSFANKSTGDLGMTVSDTTGTFLSAMGLTGRATVTRGKNALFTVNGGSVLSSASNTLDSKVTGITGLAVTVNSLTTESVGVSANTTAMQSSIQDFIDKFNTLQKSISDDTTNTVGTDGSITPAVLSNNRDVESWGDKLRSLAFSAGNASGTIGRLNDLGIDFNSTTSQLSIKDPAKLAAAMQNHPDDVASFFTTANTGFSSQVTKYITTLIGANGGLYTQQNSLNASNQSLDAQIAQIQKQIDAEREKLTSGFTAMENALSGIKSQQAQIASTFGVAASSAGSLSNYNSAKSSSSSSSG